MGWDGMGGGTYPPLNQGSHLIPSQVVNIWIYEYMDIWTYRNVWCISQVCLLGMGHGTTLEVGTIPIPMCVHTPRPRPHVPPHCQHSLYIYIYIYSHTSPSSALLAFTPRLYTQAGQHFRTHPSFQPFAISPSRPSCRVHTTIWPLRKAGPHRH